MLNVFEHCELLKDKDNTLTSNNGDLTKANGLQRASTGFNRSQRCELKLHTTVEYSCQDGVCVQKCQQKT